MDFYHRFKLGTITTYDKNIQIFKQIIQDGKDSSAIPLPAISLEPSLDLDIDDKSNFFWRYQNLSGGSFSQYLFDPIFENDHVKITPAFNRFKGSFVAHLYLSSVYEFTDMQIKALQYFGGKNRAMKPEVILSYLHLPKDLVQYEYTNDVLNIDQVIDWTDTALAYQIFEVVGRNEFLLPIQLEPTIVLTSLGNSSNARANQGELSEFKLDLNFEFEIELPVFVVLETDTRYKMEFNLYVSDGYGKLSNLIELCRESSNQTEWTVLRSFSMMSDDDGDLTQSISMEIKPEYKIEAYLFGNDKISEDRISTTTNSITISDTAKDDIYHVYIWKKNN